MKTLKLVISREKWCRGGELDGALLKDNGTMCCLGFAAKADGYKGLRRKLMPADIYEVTKGKIRNGITKRLVDKNGCNTALCNNLATINDDSVYTDNQRETFIKKRFSTINVKVTFTK